MPFKSLGLHPLLVRATQDLGYKEPTPVQAGAIPPALEGRDVIATAQTGTGKTAGFLLPTLHKLIGAPKAGTRVVVLSPTRELAEQIEDVCRGLAQHTQIRSALIVGGRPMGAQERALRVGTEVIIATPGRLLDHLNRGVANFAKADTLILDEADTMFDMGFLPDVRRIIAKMPARGQTLFFSATMPPVIAKLAHELLKNPATVQIGRRSATAVGITQAAYPVPTHLKTALLRHLLGETEMPSVLIFTRTKHNAKKLARVLTNDGFSVAELHSNRTPAQRTRAMDGFRKGEFQVMVATNIAARGIDVDHITHVISTDVPDVPEDYVHRIGRTGRAGATGDAFILVSREEEDSLARIERQVGQRLPRVTLPEFDYTAAAPPKPPASEGRGGGGGRGGQSQPKKPKPPGQKPQGRSGPPQGQGPRQGPGGGGKRRGDRGPGGRR
jgi:ATP-dependent RNA helicase RhlE